MYRLPGNWNDLSIEIRLDGVWALPPIAACGDSSFLTGEYSLHAEGAESISAAPLSPSALYTSFITTFLSELRSPILLRISYGGPSRVIFTPCATPCVTRATRT